MSIEDSREALLASFPIANLDSGTLQGLFYPVRRLNVPRYFEVAEGYVYWSEQRELANEVDAEQVSMFNGAIDRFIRIDREERVSAFASKFGPLELCEEHGMLVRHHPSCMLEEAHSGVFREPVDAWIETARQVKAVIEVATALEQGRRPEEENIRAAQFGVPAGFSLQAFQDLHAERALIAFKINRWLEWANVRPRLEVFARGRGSRRQEFLGFGLEPSSAFGLIAIQLMFACSGVHNIALCSLCGLPYLRQRRRAPQAGRRNYCDECGPKGAAKDRQRRHRQRLQRSLSERMKRREELVEGT